MAESTTYMIPPQTENGLTEVFATIWISLMPNIMILAQAVLQVFCSQGSFWFTMYRSKEVQNSATTSPTKKQKNVSAYFSCLFYIEFHDVLNVCSWQTETNMPPQLLRSWRHKKICNNARKLKIWPIIINPQTYANDKTVHRMLLYITSFSDNNQKRIHKFRLGCRLHLFWVQKKGLKQKAN